MSGLRMGRPLPVGGKLIGRRAGISKRRPESEDRWDRGRRREAAGRAGDEAGGPATRGGAPRVAYAGRGAQAEE